MPSSIGELGWFSVRGSFPSPTQGHVVTDLGFFKGAYGVRLTELLANGIVDQAEVGWQVGHMCQASSKSQRIVTSRAGVLDLAILLGHGHDMLLLHAWALLFGIDAR